MIAAKGQLPAPVPSSAPTLWRRVKAGTFPKPVTASRAKDARKWLDAQAAK